MTNKYLYVNIIGIKNPRKKAEISQTCVRGYFKILLATCRIKVKATGLENVPKDEGLMYVANHRGFFDIIAVYATAPEPVGFIAKKEIKKIPT